MQRREIIRLLLGTAAVPLLPRDVFALFKQVHEKLPATAAPRTLAAHQDATVTAIAEWIIPQTDLPGAKETRVNEFIDLILTEWCDTEDRSRFLAGLDDVDKRSQNLFGKAFVECSAVQQKSLLTTLDEELTEVREADIQVTQRHRPPLDMAYRPFFYAMKQLTLVGYFTSEEGAKSALHYEVIPSQHTQCAPLEEQGATK